MWNEQCECERRYFYSACIALSVSVLAYNPMYVSRKPVMSDDADATSPIAAPNAGWLWSFIAMEVYGRHGAFFFCIFSLFFFVSLK